MNTYKIQAMAEKVHRVLRRTNANNYKSLGLDERADTCVRIARCILILKEDNYETDHN
jgi:hypothetical protein